MAGANLTLTKMNPLKTKISIPLSVFLALIGARHDEEEKADLRCMSQAGDPAIVIELHRARYLVMKAEAQRDAALQEVQQLRTFFTSDGGEKVLVLDNSMLALMAERTRQRLAHGYDDAHDDESGVPRLLKAACCYATAAARHVTGEITNHVPPAWPWAPAFWKPTTPMRNLEKAGALVLAAMDALRRQEARDAQAKAAAASVANAAPTAPEAGAPTRPVRECDAVRWIDPDGAPRVETRQDVAAALAAWRA